MSKQVFFIDEDEYERRSCTDVLKEIFADTSIRIEPLAPLPTLADYSELVVGDEVSALILDERLNTAGGVTYTGAELAAHLRAIGAKMPIVILTNHPDDDFSQQGWAVECTLGKKSVLRDPTMPAALEFKARLSRQIEIAGAVRAEREKRYHDLLVKNADGNLTPEENQELIALETERIAPIAASEREKQQRLDTEIEKLKKLLGDKPLS
jgi:hypothetical protein